MTTESARESRGSSLVRGAPAMFLLVGAALGLFAPLKSLAAPVVLMAVVITLRFPRYVATLVTAAGATVVLVAPTLIHLAFPANRVIQAVDPPTLLAA